VVAIHRQAWARFARLVRKFLTSEVRWKARILSGALVGLLLAISGLNVVNSYVGRDFMTAVADRRSSDFYPLAMLFVGVFAASTTAAVRCSRPPPASPRGDPGARGPCPPELATLLRGVARLPWQPLSGDLGRRAGHRGGLSFCCVAHPAPALPQVLVVSSIYA
jgi:ABC-type uncharacterized transport system fused permease/ATPase subunit